MKIKFELEIGMETGVVSASLEAQAKMLRAANDLSLSPLKDSSLILLEVTNRLTETLVREVEWALELETLVRNEQEEAEAVRANSCHICGGPNH